MDTTYRDIMARDPFTKQILKKRNKQIIWRGSDIKIYRYTIIHPLCVARRSLSTYDPRG